MRQGSMSPAVSFVATCFSRSALMPWPAWSWL